MSDLISRQAAIDALHDEIVRRRISEDTNDDGALDEFDTETILRRLPSAQPEKTQHSEEDATSDCISRKAAIDALSCENPTEIYIYYDDAVKAIKEVPSAQPERKTGRWIRTRMPLTGAIEHRCSRCDTPYYMAFAMKMNYCPNCGAKMEVEHESD